MQGKTIVVTGGFGALGRVVAEVAAARGASVAVLDHAPGPPDGMAGRLGPNALLIGGLDLSSADVATKAMDNVKAKFGRLDALLNIAGGFQWETVEGGKDDAWERMYALNLMTALNACRAALPYLIESGAGRIVNVGAQSALHAASGMGPYARQQVGGPPADREPGDELKQKGVTVNAVLPSIIDTPGQPPRHAEGGLRPLGRAGRSCRGHAVPGVGRSEGHHRRADSGYRARLGAGSHGRIPEGNMARGERLSARQDGPFRPARRAVPQLGDGERRSGAERRRRVQGGARPLSPHRFARLPVGAPHPHLPPAQGTREHDLALGRPLAPGRARLDLRRGPRRHSRPDLRRERASRVLCQGAARLQRPRHGSGAVGQEDGHDRQQ